MIKNGKDYTRLMSLFFDKVNGNYGVDLYCIRIETNCECVFQGNYSNSMLGYLKRKRWDVEVANSGYIYARKKFGVINVRVTLT